MLRLVRASSTTTTRHAAAAVAVPWGRTGSTGSSVSVSTSIVSNVAIVSRFRGGGAPSRSIASARRFYHTRSHSSSPPPRRNVSPLALARLSTTAAAPPPTLPLPSSLLVQQVRERTFELLARLLVPQRPRPASTTTTASTLAPPPSPSPPQLTAEEQRLLRITLSEYASPCLLVVAGEFNSGKSSFINALLGRELCRVGVLPTTEHVYIIQHGDVAGESAVAVDVDVDVENNKDNNATNDSSSSSSVRSLTFPIEWLRDVHIVDTPGTNAVDRAHQRITEHFLPRADLLLFVTSADRPVSSTERSFLRLLRAWHKKVVVVVNKIDIVGTPAERDAIFSFVRKHVTEILGEEPLIFGVSSKHALQRKLHAVDTAEAALVSTSAIGEDGFGAVEEYIHRTLSAPARLGLKLRNPLHIVQRIVADHEAQCAAHERQLAHDERALAALQSEVTALKAEARADLDLYVSKLDHIFTAMNIRCAQFLNDSVAWSNVFQLLRSREWRQRAERAIYGDAEQQVRLCMNALVERLEDKYARQLQRVQQFVDEHGERGSRATSPSSLSSSSSFDTQRERVLAHLHRASQIVGSNVDRQEELDQLENELRRALVQLSTTQLGAMGAGAGVFALLQTTSLFDVTMILPSVLALSSLAVLPYRRRKMAEHVRTRIERMRSQVRSVLLAHTHEQMQRTDAHLADMLVPLSSFVQQQREMLSATRAHLRAAHDESADLLRCVDAAVQSVSSSSASANS